ncbi:MAG: hypothetical protein R3190_08675, partial [Thermoanaerobaculia bacterium]|nr:hypothetical protein [Thermoanaerobaculia bacterium]
TVPVLVVGAVDNDFLPFEYHAAHYARELPQARLLGLDDGEGHFAFLDPCNLDLEVNGVPLCRDRPGVDRIEVRRRLVAEIDAFLKEVFDAS